MYVCIYECMYVYMNVCMCLCMCVCVCVYVCMCILFIYLLSLLHYFGLIIHAVIYMLVSFAGDAVTSIMAPVIAFPLQF